MNKARWMVKRKAIDRDGELLQIVEVYAPDENKEVVKQENKQWTYDRELIILRGDGGGRENLQALHPLQQKA